jgi:hypothetical protein
MWNGTLLMINFAGLGEAMGNGEACGVGDSAGVGAVLGVVSTAGVEGLATGEFVCWLVNGWVQPPKTKTRPATTAAGTKPLLPYP